MPTIKEIHDSIKHLDESQQLLKYPEIKELPHILQKDESIERIASGVYDGRKGILAATEKRLLFICKGLIFSLKIYDFPYDAIKSIKPTTGFNLGDLDITTAGGSICVELIDKPLLKGLVEYIGNRIAT